MKRLHEKKANDLTLRDLRVYRGVFSNTQGVNVCSDSLGYFQKSADAIVGLKRVLSPNKYKEVSPKTEGLNVKVREPITMFSQRRRKAEPRKRTVCRRIGRNPKVTCKRSSAHL